LTVFVLIAILGYYAWQMWTTPKVTIEWISSSWSVQGSPSIPASLIWRVLKVSGSPALDDAQALYDEGVRSGIDPAFALAFFLHESTFGTQGVARETHSLGNIICTPGYHCIGRFRSYASWVQGFRDWYALITREYLSHGLKTVDQIIPVYAPANENNVQAYVCAVKRAVSGWRAGAVTIGSQGCG
jgi:hypothetical protein